MSDSRPHLTSVEAKESINAERRWEWCKRYVEPYIKIASNDDSAEGFLPNHSFLIRSYHLALCIVKCRKIAHSWGISLKALSRAATQPRSTTIIGSYDEDEAREKLNYLEWIYSVLPRAAREELRMSDGSEIRKFANGSRIRFMARKEPTGPGASIEWDEFSIEPPGRVKASQILTGAFGCTTHGGTVSIGGTQRGPETVFNQIVSGEITKRLQNDPSFAGLKGKSWVVASFPWWISPALSLDPLGAAREAPDMETHDRVTRYGNDKLVQKYLEYVSSPDMGLEIFQREFEMRILDDKESYFDDDLLEYCYSIAGHDYDFTYVELEGAKYGQYGDALKPAKRALETMMAKYGRNLRWGWGMDIGDDRDKDEIFIGHMDPNDRYKIYPRMNISMHKMPFDGKEAMGEFIMQTVRPIRGGIDGTKGSLGRPMSQKFEAVYKDRAAAVQFTMDSKTVMATGLKARMEAGRLPLPPRTPKYNKLHNQLKRIKREERGLTVRFDAVRNKSDHADCYDDQTEILTDAGWLPFREVTTDHKVASLVDGRCLEFVNPLRVIRYEYSGDMVRVKNKQVDLLVTPNHRMWVNNTNWETAEFRFLEASEVLKYPGIQWRYKKDAVWIGNDSPDVPFGTPEQWAKFLGFFISEGCTSKRGVVLYQKPGDVLDQMIQTVLDIGLHPGYKETWNGVVRIDIGCKALMEALPGGKCYEKRLPRYVMDWSPRLLRILFDAMMDGDGSRGKDVWCYHTSSRGLADDVMELLLRAGLSGSVVENTPLKGWNLRPMYRVNVNFTRLQPRTNHSSRGVSHTTEQYDGMVHCVTVPSGIIFVRRNNVGVWCGNCVWALAIFNEVMGRPSVWVPRRGAVGQQAGPALPHPSPNRLPQRGGRTIVVPGRIGAIR
jgi:hypothetical protein